MNEEAVAKANPLKQGLKHSFLYRFILRIDVAKANPLKQGLKQPYEVILEDLQSRRKG